MYHYNFVSTNQSLKKKKNLLIIVAAGSGSRINSKIPKQFIKICGKSILEYTLDAMLNSKVDFEIVIVTNKDYFLKVEQITQSYKPPIHVAEGGSERFYSVQNGLQGYLKEWHEFVWVHDAVRCMITPAFVDKCFQFATKHGSAVPCIQVKDSIRKIVEHGSIHLDRRDLVIVQTPQIFKSSVLAKSFQQAYEPNFTDEASLVEAMNQKVHIMEGDIHNFKITYDIDLKLAEAILR